MNKETHFYLSFDLTFTDVALVSGKEFAHFLNHQHHHACEWLYMDTVIE